MEKEITSVIAFRVGREEALAFKKYQLLLKINESMNTQETFLFLLNRVKEKLEREKKFLNHWEGKDFLEKFTGLGKKKLKILSPKKIQIAVTEREKELFYDIAYSIIKKDNSEEYSYPYVFKRILKINEDMYEKEFGKNLF